MIAVLTGDIVRSQDLPESKRAKLHAYLKQAADYVDLGESIEVFGGDSWQAYCPNPASAVAQALILRAYLYGTHQIETRVSIGIGTYETLKPEKISLSQGEAFVLSGRGLESMFEEQHISASPSEKIHSSSRSLLVASVALLDGLSSTWTSKQAQAVALDLYSVLPYRGEERKKDLAKKFTPPISPQAFGKHLAKAKWDLVKDALHLIASGLNDAPLAQNP